MIFVSAAIVALLTACGPEQGVFKPDTPTGKLLGTIIVENGSYEVTDGETIYSDYIQNNVEAELTLIEDQEEMYNITLYKVSFSNKMPVTIDMTIPGVHINKQGVISGDEIVPYAGILGEFPRYTIRNLTGKVVFDTEGKAGALSFEMLCGEYPTRYEGMYTQDEE